MPMGEIYIIIYKKVLQRLLGKINCIFYGGLLMGIYN
jgi:hypothetical protein